jgi:hypothetical protein
VEIVARLAFSGEFLDNDLANASWMTTSWPGMV